MGGGPLAHRSCDGRGRVRTRHRERRRRRARTVSLDVSKADAADMRTECLRYLLDHKHEDAVRYDMVATAITDNRQATLRHLVVVCRWSED